MAKRNKPNQNTINTINKKENHPKLPSLFTMKKSFSEIKWDSGFFSIILCSYILPHCSPQNLCSLCGHSLLYRSVVMSYPAEGHVSTGVNSICVLLANNLGIFRALQSYPIICSLWKAQGTYTRKDILSLFRDHVVGYVPPKTMTAVVEQLTNKLGFHSYAGPMLKLPTVP